MARMTRTIISIPGDEKRWLDAYGKRHRISSAEAVRRAIREFRGRKEPAGDRANVKAVQEDRAAYGSPLPPDLTDMAELRRRAIAAAGRFASGVSDLSVEHDLYLVEEMTEELAEGKAEHDKKAPGGAKKGGGTR